MTTTLVDNSIPTPSSLPDLLKALEFKSVQVGECGYFFDDDLLNNFAFYSVQDDKVAVRISLSHAAEVCRGQITQIGLLLTIPESLKAQLHQAQNRKAGFLMKDAAKLTHDAITTYKFSRVGRQK